MPKKAVLYTYIINPEVGPGHIIPVLQRAEEIRAGIDEFSAENANSYLLLKMREDECVIPLLEWLAVLDGRKDTNIIAYGDGQLGDIAKKLISNFNKAKKILVKKIQDVEELKRALERLVKKHSQKMLQKIRFYVRYYEENFDFNCEENGIGARALVICPLATEINLPRFKYFTQVDFLCVKGRFSNSYYVHQEQGAHNENAVKFPIVCTRMTSAIALHQADIVILSTPYMFFQDFLGALTLAALFSNNAPIHIFGDDNKIFEAVVAEFSKRIPIEFNSSSEQELCELSYLKKRLTEIKWERISDAYSPNLNKTIRLAKRPAVISEGIGTMDTISNAPKHFMLQASSSFQEKTDEDRFPGLIAALDKSEFTEGNDIYPCGNVVVAYRNAFRKFVSVFCNEPSEHFSYNAKINPSSLNTIPENYFKEEISLEDFYSAMNELYKIHSLYGKILYYADNFFCQSLPITDETLGVHYYREMERLKNERPLIQTDPRFFKPLLPTENRLEVTATTSPTL